MGRTAILPVLTDIGLSHHESSLYLCLLELGPQSASHLAKQTGVTRTNTYNLLAQLEEKRLVERRGSGRKIIFHPLNPRVLEGLLDEQQSRLTARREQLRTSMQDLIVDFSLAEGRPGVFRFEGKQGMIRVYEELIRDRAMVNSIVDRRLLRTVIADYNPEYIRKRIRYKIPSRVITPETPPIHSDDERELREVRSFDAKHFSFEMDLKVTSKKVVMTTFPQESISGIIMTDPEIVRNYNFLFEFLWSIAKKHS